MNTLIMLAWRVSLIGILVAAMLQNMVAMCLFGLTTVASVILKGVCEIYDHQNKPPRK